MSRNTLGRNTASMMKIFLICVLGIISSYYHDEIMQSIDPGFKIIIENSKKIKSPHNRDITKKRVTSGGIHLCDTARDLIGSGIKLQTSSTDNDVLSTTLTRRLSKT